MQNKFYLHTKTLLVSVVVLALVAIGVYALFSYQERSYKEKVVQVLNKYQSAPKTTDEERSFAARSFIQNIRTLQESRLIKPNYSKADAVDCIIGFMNYQVAAAQAEMDRVSCASTWPQDYFCSENSTYYDPSGLSGPLEYMLYSCGVDPF